MTVFITGLGWVTSKGMASGRNGKPFSLESGKLPRIERKDVFDQPTPHFGRMDGFSRLGLCAVALALKDAELDRWTEKRNMGVIAQSKWGCLKTDSDYYRTIMKHGGAMASPAVFSYTLPNCFLGEVAVSFGLSGTGFVINDSSPHGLTGIQAGLSAMLSGESEKMICGVCDLEPPLEIPPSGPVLPGAVFLVLEKHPDTVRTPYGSISLDPKGALLLDHQAVVNIETLVKICLIKQTPLRKPPA